MDSIQGVPLLELTRFDEAQEQEYIENFKAFLRSGRYIMGPQVTSLEEECAEYSQSKHALGVSSGTDALLLSLMALGIGQGDEVICPTYTFFATAGCIWRTGAKPVFVDSKLSDYNIDPAQIEAAITPKTKAIIPVHLFGQCANMEEIMPLAEKNNLYVIEDAAQAIGSEMTYQGKTKRAGSVGHFGCFSFFPSKNMGGFGDGGLVTASDDELHEQARIMRAHGGKPKYYHQVVGGNFRLDPLQATLLRPKLERLDGWTQKRQSNAALYTKILKEAGVAKTLEADATPKKVQTENLIHLPIETQPRHIYNQYTLLLPNNEMRDALREKLNAANIGNEIYYPVPMHRQKCFSALEAMDGDFPVANFAAQNTVAVPIFPELTEDEILYVATHIISAFKDLSGEQNGQ